jgi:enoyl-CoA hydratase
MMNNVNGIVKTQLHESGILHITLNRPEQLNALSHDVLTQLSSLLTQVQFDPTVKAILLSGEGKGFCAGADIKQLKTLDGQSGLQFARFGQQVFRQLETLGKPSLAAIHGFAFGGGCELAMSATLRLAAANAVFGQPEIKLGVIPGFGGTQRLARLIGKGRALDICLTGKRFSATDAMAWGLVNEVVPAADLLARATDILTGLAASSAIAMQGIMSAINLGLDLPMEEALAIEAVHFGLCCTSADKQEGVAAFLEKRTAVFNGEKHAANQ